MQNCAGVERWEGSITYSRFLRARNWSGTTTREWTSSKGRRCTHTSWKWFVKSICTYVTTDHPILLWPLGAKGGNNRDTRFKRVIQLPRQYSWLCCLFARNRNKSSIEFLFYLLFLIISNKQYPLTRMSSSFINFIPVVSDEFRRLLPVSIRGGKCKRK